MVAERIETKNLFIGITLLIKKPMYKNAGTVMIKVIAISLKS